MLDDVLKNKLETTINECDKHVTWMSSAYNNISHLFPLSADNYHNLEDSYVPLIDQYVYRFTKLQDTMGSRLFTIILSLLAEDVKSMSFIDMLNRLEQLGILDSKDLWLNLRNLRNRSAHEYDDVVNSEILNQLFSSKNIIEKIYIKAKQHCDL